MKRNLYLLVTGSAFAAAILFQSVFTSNAQIATANSGKATPTPVATPSPTPKPTPNVLNDDTIEKVDTELTVAGLNNTITYRDGAPQVQDLGTGNTITKG